MTLSQVVLLLVGATVAVRLVPRVWPKLFPGSTTSHVLRALAADRTSRHADLDLLSAYFRYRSRDSNRGALPDRTWQDLDLDDVFASLDYAESEPGRQYLYDLLRTPTRSREQLAALDRGVLRHHADQLVTTLRRHHGERDAGVARRRLQDRRAGLQQAVLLGGLHHVQRGTILDRTGRVAVFELRPQPHIGGQRQPRESDERCLPDGVDEGVVTHRVSAARSAAETERQRGTGRRVN